MKSVQTQSFSGPKFPLFGLNTEIYEENLRILSEYKKIRTRKNSAFGHLSHSGDQAHLGMLLTNQITEFMEAQYFQNESWDETDFLCAHITKEATI